jgi:hypothetical protein
MRGDRPSGDYGVAQILPERVGEEEPLLHSSSPMICLIC